MIYWFENMFYKIAFLIFLFSSCLETDFLIGKENDLSAFKSDDSIRNNDRLMLADELFLAGLYDRAIETYQEILHDALSPQEEKTNDAGQAKEAIYLHVSFQLAEAFYLSERYLDAIELLQDLKNKTSGLSQKFEAIRSNSIYLLGLTYKENGQKLKAREAFENYLKIEDKTFSPFQDEACFEIGLSDFLEGNFKAAECRFASIVQKTPGSHLGILSQLYTIRIRLAENQVEKASASLASLKPLVNSNDDLSYEISYLLGQTFFQTNDFIKAAESFESSIPKQLPKACNWYKDALYFLGWSYLNLCDESQSDQKSQADYFSKAESTFQKLSEIAPDEKVFLAIGQCYLTSAKKFKNNKAYALAEGLLSKKGLFKSPEIKTQALLLLAEAAPSYSSANALYLELTSENNRERPYYGKGWYLRALNDFEEGKRLRASNCINLGKETFLRSAEEFELAFDLLKNNDPVSGAAALKYHALALWELGSKEEMLLAFKRLDDLLNRYPKLLNSIEMPDEIFYLHGFFALHLEKLGEGSRFETIGKESLKEAAAIEKSGLKNSQYGQKALMHLAAILYEAKNFAEAEETYLKLIQDFPNSSHLPEALLGAAFCADQLQREAHIGKERRRQVFEKFPESPFAKEAFFSFYTYRDYLLGSRDAVKQLDSFIKNYSETPLLMQANYLIALDFKRNRKTPEGKWLRKKSLTEAIDAFLQVESLFIELKEKGLIPEDKLTYYTTIYYRAILERAISNFAIAEESEGAKRQIYLEYAEGVFEDIRSDLKTLQSGSSKHIFQTDEYLPLLEESSLRLAQIYIKRQKEQAAKTVFEEMLKMYKESGVTEGYTLSRIKYEQGRLELDQENYKRALEHFQLAEEASKGDILSTDEKLDLWIQESACFVGQKMFEEGLLILSRVANDDAISSLRLKAMYLRTHIYELQGRPELARKQLESVAKKGGDWALKAKEKLEKEYGY